MGLFSRKQNVDFANKTDTQIIANAHSTAIFKVWAELYVQLHNTEHY